MLPPLLVRYSTAQRLSRERLLSVALLFVTLAQRLSRAVSCAFVRYYRATAFAGPTSCRCLLGVILEGDSQIVCYSMDNHWSTPYQCSSLLNRILVLLKDREWSIRHIYREGHQVADLLAKQGAYQDQDLDVEVMPQDVKRLIAGDNIGIPTYRTIRQHETSDTLDPHQTVDTVNVFRIFAFSFASPGSSFSFICLFHFRL